MKEITLSKDTIDRIKDALDVCHLEIPKGKEKWNELIEEIVNVGLDLYLEGQ